MKLGVCVLYFVYLQCLEFARARTVTNVDACNTPGVVTLASKGYSSAVMVALKPHKSVECVLKVTAPVSHIINMQFIESTIQRQKIAGNNNNNNTQLRQCMMKIYLGSSLTVPFWKADLCSSEPLPKLDLLTPDVRIVWNPPPNKSSLRERSIVLTAVGEEEACTDSERQHPCLKVGNKAVFCISKELVCDGFEHCPHSSTNSDEDNSLCDSNLYEWKNYAEEISKFLRRIDNSKEKVLKDWKLVNKFESNTNTSRSHDKPNKANDSISNMLSKYGPWGYLMLGLLICGTVLMFCGLWECCFRKPKNINEAQVEVQQPTTVLIINPPEAVTNPPNYDELDQPPSYMTLFPNIKNVAVAPILEATGSGENLDGSSSARASNQTEEMCSRSEE